MLKTAVSLPPGRKLYIILDASGSMLEEMDGKPKFDLTKFDPAYFERLRSRVEAAGQRGIYTSVMLFERGRPDVASCAATAEAPRSEAATGIALASPII